MDWLKDKKNLPIVVGLAVFVLLAAGGLVAFETGLIGGPPAPASGLVVPTAPRFAGGSPPGSPPPDVPPLTGLGGGRPGITPTPGARTASATPVVPAAPKLINPAVGPDPFGIPGGQKRLAQQVNASLNSPAGAVVPLRDRLPMYNLFTIHPPAPPPVVDVPGSDPGAQNYHLTGIANSDGGILAVLETSGQSQTVKPGDSLPDGGKVLSIQTSSVTLRTPGGSTVSIPLTSGAGPSDQPQNGQDPNAGDPRLQPNAGDPRLQPNAGDPRLQPNAGDPRLQPNAGDPRLQPF